MNYIRTCAVVLTFISGSTAALAQQVAKPSGPTTQTRPCSSCAPVPVCPPGQNSSCVDWFK